MKTENIGQKSDCVGPKTEPRNKKIKNVSDVLAAY